jgi:hypothetical protein
VKPVPEALDRVTAAVVTLAEAEVEYRASLLGALDAGAGYADTARAAGVSRQWIRKFALVHWAPSRTPRRRSTAKRRVSPRRRVAS